MAEHDKPLQDALYWVLRFVAPWYPCGCHSVWCVLDNVFRCKVDGFCQRHEQYIIGEYHND